MSRRLDLVVASIGWIAGFTWVGLRGSWGPLAAVAMLCAARLLVADPVTRRLLVPTSTAIGLALLGAGAMIAATYVSYPLLARAAPSLLRATDRLYVLLHAGGYGRVALPAMIVAVATCEEIVWRGRPLEADQRRQSREGGAPRVGRVVSIGLLYGACHLASGSVLLAAIAAGCGIWWGMLRVAGRSLWTSVLVHVAWDLAVLVLWPLASGPGR